MPERSADLLRAWLEWHPEIEIVSRDRADDYIKGIAAGADLPPILGEANAACAASLADPGARLVIAECGVVRGL